jgi:hypothetical protein
MKQLAAIASSNNGVMVIPVQRAIEVGKQGFLAQSLYG